MRFLIVMLAFALVLGTATANAEPAQADKDRAAELVYAGDDKRDKGDHNGALKLYEEADAIMGVPSTGIEVARELIALGRFVEALAKLEEIDEYVKKPGEPEAFDAARDEARSLATELAPRIPRVLVTVVGATPSTIRVDDRDVSFVPSEPIPLDPGEHQIEARAGTSVDSTTLTVKEGDKQEITLTLSAGSEGTVGEETDGTEISPLVWVGFGIGGAGILIGSITGGVAFERTSFLAGDCNSEKACPADNADIIDEAVTLSHVSTASFVIGGLGVGLGVTMLVVSLTADEPSDDAGAVLPVLAPGYAGVVGRF